MDNTNKFYIDGEWVVPSGSETLDVIYPPTEEPTAQIVMVTKADVVTAVSSGDLEYAAEVGQKLRAGNVHLNGAGVDPVAPFGGYKQSGNGREFGKWGLVEFLETKAILGCNVAS